MTNQPSTKETMMTTYSVESENGQAMSEGIQSEDEALSIAQDHANEIGETVYICRSTGGKTKEIAPTRYATCDCSDCTKLPLRRRVRMPRPANANDARAWDRWRLAHGIAAR